MFTCSYYHAKAPRNMKDVLEDSGMFSFFDKIVTYLHSVYISLKSRCRTRLFSNCGEIHILLGETSKFTTVGLKKNAG